MMNNFCISEYISDTFSHRSDTFRAQQSIPSSVTPTLTYLCYRFVKYEELGPKVVMYAVDLEQALRLPLYPKVRLTIISQLIFYNEPVM